MVNLIIYQKNNTNGDEYQKKIQQTEKEKLEIKIPISCSFFHHVSVFMTFTAKKYIRNAKKEHKVIIQNECINVFLILKINILQNMKMYAKK